MGGVREIGENKNGPFGKGCLVELLWGLADTNPTWLRKELLTVDERITLK